MINLFRRLKKQGVLSINQRNSDFVLRYNPRKLFPLVDNKLKTKQLAIKAGIAVPPLYGIIETEQQIKTMDALLAPYNDFVVKPARGSGGDGILVFTDKILDRYRQVNGKLTTSQELSYHLSCLLSGAYSLGGSSDFAIIEKRIVVDSLFEDVSYDGIPDIRIITLLGYPAMAMARLPTRTSGGKANLHQGAIGVGIDLATGKTLNGVFQNDVIDYHPDTLQSIRDIQIPYWNEILEIASRCYELTNLGYLGVDIVLDRDLGPMMLEVNARPGLNIQIANHEGGLNRYRLIEERAKNINKELTADKVAFSRNTFSI